jgi:hypothetical protein
MVGNIPYRATIIAPNVAHTSVSINGFSQYPEGYKINGLQIADNTAIGINDKIRRVTGDRSRLEKANKLIARMGKVARAITKIIMIIFTMMNYLIFLSFWKKFSKRTVIIMAKTAAIIKPD